MFIFVFFSHFVKFNSFILWCWCTNIKDLPMASGTSSDQTSKHAHKMSKLDDFDFPYCRDATVTYEKLAKIGQGTFG